MKSEIKNYAFRPELPHEFEMVSLQQLLGQHPEILTCPHRTGFYQILWFDGGDTTLLVDFRPIRVTSGMIVFLDKSSVRRFECQGNVTGKAVLFSDAFFCRTDDDRRLLRSGTLFNTLFGVSNIRFSSSSEERGFALLYELMESEFLKGSGRYQADILRSHLQAMLLMAEREIDNNTFHATAKRAVIECIQRFSELLERDFRTHKAVAAYAEELCITQKRLAQATSTALGMSPKQMIDERLVLEAKRLLVHTSESVKQIAYLLGFDEPTNFIKFFRRVSGSTPLEFRDAHPSA
jgi:AraC-like DNA-binding protein